MAETELECQCSPLHITKQEMEDLKESMPLDENIFMLSDFFKMFGDGTRLKIMYFLQKQELCVCDLAECMSMSSPAISHQLRILKSNRLIKSRREGKSVFYSLDDHHIHHIMQEGMIHLEEENR